MAARMPCTMASRSTADWEVLILDIDTQPWSTFAGSRCPVSALNEEYSIAMSTGVARMNSGRLDTVQYLKKPLFLQVVSHLVM